MSRPALYEQYKPGDHMFASDAARLSAAFNRTVGTNGVNVNYVSGGFQIEGNEGAFWEGYFSFGNYEIDVENRKVKFNKGWLFHAPRWYEVSGEEVTITGGTLAVPQWVVVEYIHRSLARIVTTGQTSYTSMAGLSRFPLKGFYLPDGERLAELPSGVIRHIGDLHFGGPVMP